MSTSFISPSRRIILPGFTILVVVVSLLSAGCIGPFEPGSTEIPGGQMTLEPTPSQTMSTEQTPTQPLRNGPAELATSGYIERSYGYVPYTTPPEHRLTVIESNSRKDASGNIIIYGRLKNEGPGSLSYLQVTFNLFDNNGNLLGNAYAHVEYFGAGQTWHFQSDPVPATNYQYFKIAGVMAQ